MLYMGLVEIPILKAISLLGCHFKLDNAIHGAGGNTNSKSYFSHTALSSDLGRNLEGELENLERVILR